MGIMTASQINSNYCSISNPGRYIKGSLLPSSDITISFSLQEDILKSKKATESVMKDVQNFLNDYNKALDKLRREPHSLEFPKSYDLFDTTTFWKTFDEEIKIISQVVNSHGIL